MRDLSDLTLKPSDFPALQTLCAVDKRFPKDFAAWEELIALATREAHARGLFPPPLLVDPGEFETWCKRGALLPTIDGLRAYAIVRRGQVTKDSLASWLGAGGSAGEINHPR